MRRIALFTSALSALLATPALAGLDLTWDACSSASSQLEATFACDQPDSTHRLVVSFQSHVDAPAVTAMRGRLLIVSPSHCSDPVPFWHFEHGGCNDAGITMSNFRPPGSEACATPWWFTGAFAHVSYSYQARNADSPTNERYGILDFAVEVDPFREPVAIQAGTNYYAFHLDFSMIRASECQGCSEPVGIVGYATLEGPGSYVDLGGPGLVGNCVGINGGGWYCGTGSWRCSPTPALDQTWGGLKTIYRSP